MNTSFTQIMTSTLDAYEKTFTDNIIKNSVLLYRLQEKGCLVPLDGGDYIREQIMYAANTNVGSYSGLETLPISEQTVFTTAQFNWKELYGTITISDLDKNKNSGSKTQIFDLVQGLIENCDLSLRQLVNTQLYGDGTGNSSKDITGLKAMVSATGTYGGIAKETYSYWQSNVEATAENLGLAKMRSSYSAASRGKVAGRPDMIVMTETLFNYFEGLHTPNLRYENTKLADAGFMNLRFKGADCVWDEDMTSTYVYLLTTPMIRLKYHRNAFFKHLPPVRANDQTGDVIIITFMGNLTTKSCKKHALQTGKTAT